MPFSRWIRDSYVSAGMNNAHSSTTSLLFLSSPLLVFSRSPLFSSQLPHLKTSSPSFSPLPPSSSPHLCKRGHYFLVTAASLSSGQPSSLLQHLTHHSCSEWDFPVVVSVVCLSSSFTESSLLEFLGIVWPDVFFEAFILLTFTLKWLNVLMYRGHYPLTGGGSAAIDSVWQLHHWLTGVIRREALTDKMAEKAEDKLPNQNLGKE